VLPGEQQAGRESFRDTTHPTTGRINYGSGRKLAQDWQLKPAVDKRSGDVTFANHGKSGKQNFGEACLQFTARMRVRSRLLDRAGNRSLSGAVEDREVRASTERSRPAGASEVRPKVRRVVKFHEHR
jgi:hypothetical protein